MKYGFHIDATYCVDGVLSGGLYEEELPPKPPADYFDARFVEHRPGSSCIGVGTRVHLQEPDKRDTFQLEFQPGSGGYPITLFWSIGCDEQEYALLRYALGGDSVEIDMKVDDSIVLSDTAVHSVSIVAAYLSHLNCSTPVREGSEKPQRFELAANYPNPFNPSTSITFNLPAASGVSLRVFDLLGREVAVLIDGKEIPGEHIVEWNTDEFPGGVYFYRLIAGEFNETRKMVLLK